MDDSLNQNEKQEIRAFVGMPQVPVSFKEKIKKNKKIIFSISIIIIFLIVIYFLIPLIKKNTESLEEKILRENIEAGERLKAQMINMPEEEKIKKGEELEKIYKENNKLTPEQQKDINNFLKS